MPEEHGWDQYSRLVLQQLETLSSGIEALRAELQDVKNQLTELKAREDRVLELREWKEKVDEVASPSQLKTALQEIEDLKMFKTKAVTIFAGVQFLMAAIMAFSTLF
jgi:uncharacterized coiled-coil DUF342 family protein|tara:strand:+ start:521 stop:841 length:321 start_codon:yes stop_codon:yes gene_type:complete